MKISICQCKGYFLF
ncbi:hypothetical protein EY664_04915 [Enterococcus gallinarum]|nr:hypothetical protein [Enterococcus gallinarum]MBO6421249.1 hypothetical protein [Enterococcus gallinarum]